MKKLILFLLLFLPLCANAQDSFCKSPPYPLSNNFVQTANKITGLNFFSTSAVETAIRSQLKKDFKGKYKINLDSFSLLNLSQGKIKKLTIEGKNLDADGIRISNFNAYTLCDYNRIKIEKEGLAFYENMLVRVQTKLSENDLKNTVQSINYKSGTKNLNAGLFSFKLQDVSIVNDRLRFKIKTDSFLASSTFDLDTALSAVDSKIQFSDIKIAGSKFDLTPFTPIINKFNPFVFNAEILNNKNSLIKIKEVNIKDKNVYIEALAYIPKNI